VISAEKSAQIAVIFW